MPAMPANGFLGNRFRNYANMTAVGALIVFVMALLGLATFVTVRMTDAVIEAHKEQTTSIKEVATEIRTFSREMRSIDELRKELREESRETHKLLRELIEKEKQ